MAPIKIHLFFHLLMNFALPIQQGQYLSYAFHPMKPYMILTISENRQDAKLFLSRKIDNEWTNPKYIGDIIEHDMSGNFPYITAEGKFLIFTRGFGFFYILPTKVFANQE